VLVAGAAALRHALAHEAEVPLGITRHEHERDRCAEEQTQRREPDRRRELTYPRRETMHEEPYERRTLGASRPVDREVAAPRERLEVQDERAVHRSLAGDG
jgi:hypothetical protein